MVTYVMQLTMTVPTAIPLIWTVRRIVRYNVNNMRIGGLSDSTVLYCGGARKRRRMSYRGDIPCLQLL